MRLVADNLEYNVTFASEEISVGPEEGLKKPKHGISVILLLIKYTVVCAGTKQLQKNAKIGHRQFECSIKHFVYSNDFNTVWEFFLKI
jgi:hypothetical protein